jgi:hypothetical protein
MEMNLSSKSLVMLLSLMLVASFFVGCGGSELGNEEEFSAEEQEVKFKVNYDLGSDGVEGKQVESLPGKIIVYNSQQQEVTAKEVDFQYNNQKLITFRAKLPEKSDLYKLVAKLNGQVVAENNLAELQGDVVQVELELDNSSDVGIESMPAVVRPSGFKVNNYYNNDKKKALLSWDRRNVGNYPFRQNYVIYRASADDFEGEPQAGDYKSGKMIASELDRTEYIDNEVELGQTYYYWLQGQSRSNSDYLGRAVGPCKIIISNNPKEELAAPEIISDNQFRMERFGEVIGTQPYGDGHDYQPYYREIKLGHERDVEIQYKVGAVGNWKTYEGPFAIDGSAYDMFSPDSEQKVHYRAYNPDTDLVSKTVTKTYVRTILRTGRLMDPDTENGEEVYFHYQFSGDKWTEVPGRQGKYIKDGTWEFVTWEQTTEDFAWTANVDGKDWLVDGPDRLAKPGHENDGSLHVQ